MRNLNRNRQRIYIATLLEDKGTDEFGKSIYDVPFVFEENLMPVDGNSEIAVYGERSTRMYKSVTSSTRWRGKIKEFDVAYLDGADPIGERVNGSKANYKVVSIRNTLNTVTIYFEKK